MESTIELQKKIRTIHGVLTDAELARLRTTLGGYGHFIDASRRLNIHRNTLRHILNRGYGTAIIIQKIRNELLP